MFNEDFDFYPDHQRNMHFEKPMHGPPGHGPPPRGPPGHHMRPPGPPMRRRMPDCPPNFRPPREPLFDDYNPPHGMPPPGGPGGPHGQNHMNRGPPPGPVGPKNQFGPPRQPPPQPGMQKGPFPPQNSPLIQNFGPGFPPGGGNVPPLNRPPHPNHPPHNSSVDLTGDLYVETKTKDGQIYYYHARTREATWVKPSGPNVKILNQEKIEAIAAAANSEKPMNQIEKKPEMGVVNPPNPVPNQFVPMGPILPPPNMGMLPPPTFRLPPPPFPMPPPGMPGMMAPGFPPFGIPPPVFPGVPMGGMIPNCVTPEPNTTTVTTTVSETKNATQDSGGPEDWAEFKAEGDKVYYYNKKTGVCTWDKPACFTTNVEPVAPAVEEEKVNETSESNASQPVPENDSNLTNETPSENEKEKETESDPAMEVDASESTNNVDISLTQESEQETVPSSAEVVENGNVDISEDKQESLEAKDDTKDKDKEETTTASVEEPEKPVDKSRPVSSTAIPGSPWCLVITGDNRWFYFKPSCRVSVWERPDELKNRPDVDKLIEVLTSKAGEEKAQAEKDTEGPDAKKIKLEDNEEGTKNQDEKSPKKISPGKESAIMAELQAAKSRAVISLETRMKKFRDLLAEKDVSAFSTWEKELHKIVFDSRYLLLTSKERKAVFEKYVKERAEEERSERKKKVRERKDEFRKLLEEASLTTKSSFSQFAQKYNRDERYRMIEKMKERECMFNEYIEELRKKERDERFSQREKIKNDFISLLKSHTFDSHRWSDVKKGLCDDSRYKAVESSSLREEWFKEYINKQSHGNEDDAAKEREKQERVEASIREREKEVQRTLHTHLRERDKERELHKHDEAVQHFKALLTDLVRSPDVSWHDMKKTLRKDHRYVTISAALQREERERFFEEHISFLNRKKKEKFRELLDETPEITLTSSWKEVKKYIKDDPRCSKFSSSDRKCEKEFKEYLKDKMVAAKADFRELLKETKIITYKSRKLIEETDHLHDIEKVLQNDKRYLVLQCIEDERRELLMSYIETLDRKGPPPPPTASEPSRRNTK